MAMIKKALILAYWSFIGLLCLLMIMAVEGSHLLPKCDTLEQQFICVQTQNPQEGNDE